jgi:flagellar hook-basal body complex protein FliE
MKELQIQSVLQQMRSLAATVQFENQPDRAVIESSQNDSRVNFSSILTNAIHNVNDLQSAAGDAKTRFELGDPDVSLPSVMVAMSKSSIAYETLNQVRSRLLSAYQEIMRMSV